MYQQLMSCGGKEITHFFDKNGQPIFKINRSRQILPILDIILERSKSNFGIANNLFWWNDPIYARGRITSAARRITIIDVAICNN